MWLCLVWIICPHLIVFSESLSEDVLTPMYQSPKDKVKGLASPDCNSPVTPVEKLKKKVDSSHGPWSKSLLDKEKGKDLSELLEDPTLRRSKRMIKQKMGTKRNIAPREIVLGAQWCLHQSVLQSSRILVLLFVMWKKANSPYLHLAKRK